ncbi:hypothetical protein [Nocardia salmonicida]|uniref:hypothetical protein n=1 Tax=Nocardia salmonicida TaxID=53431 RepID=UPI0033E4D132
MITDRTRALIACAAQDYAAAYYGGPFRFGFDETVDYVTRQHLQSVAAEHGNETVAAMVRAYLSDHPELLTRPQSERRTAARFRASLAQARLTAAENAATAGEHARARRLLAEAEQIDPGHVAAALSAADPVAPNYLTGAA